MNTVSETEKVTVVVCFSLGLNFVPCGHHDTVYLPFSVGTGKENSYRSYTDSIDKALEGKQTESLSKQELVFNPSQLYQGHTKGNDSLMSDVLLQV